MVVPVERLSGCEKIKKYVGNDLTLSIIDNKRLLIITGNNCKVKLSENSGRVKIIGDNCEITVSKGNGNIEYIGNNGKIVLGLDVSEDVVTYIGNQGEITVDTCSSSNRKGVRCEPVSPQDDSKTNSTENHINISNGNKIQIATTLLPNTIHIPILKICHRTLERKPKS